MEKIAFLIPIHPPKYTILYKLIDKLLAHNKLPHIYCVFSYENDYIAFERKSLIYPIILESTCSKSQLDSLQLVPFKIISFKKYKGLEYLSNLLYDYIILCDSEIDIVIDNFTYYNVKHKIETLFENKNLYAGNVANNDFRKYFAHSLNVFVNDDDNKRIQTLLENGDLYHWWSDLPVICRDHLPEFFTSVGWPDMHEDKLMADPGNMYGHFLALYHGFSIINTTPITKRPYSLEWLITSDKMILDKLSEIGVGFCWVLAQLYDMNKTYFDNKKTFLLFHTDRHGS